jgi:hypothetical protein
MLSFNNVSTFAVCLLTAAGVTVLAGAITARNKTLLAMASFQKAHKSLTNLTIRCLVARLALLLRQ